MYPKVAFPRNWNKRIQAVSKARKNPRLGSVRQACANSAGNSRIHAETSSNKVGRLPGISALLSIKAL